MIVLCDFIEDLLLELTFIILNHNESWQYEY